MRREHSEIRRWLLRRLGSATAPVTRDALAAELVGYVAGTFGAAWSASTAGRRIREAAARLEREGHPVLSDGRTGYRLASTAEERAAATRKIERMGLSLLRRAADLRGLTLTGELQQLSLDLREAV